jgi:Pyruvate/2-oxoacid:ferredoxin oxidoreductase delta subunit
MQFANEKDRLFDLANLMNEQSLTPMMVTDDLLYVIDAALLPEEVEFLLEMGGGRLSRRQVEANVPVPPEDFERVLDALLDKGQVTELPAQPGEEGPVFHVMSLFPGWFEFYLMRGSETPDRKEFAQRLSKFFSLAREIPADVLNAIMKDTAPNRAIVLANPSEPKLIAVNEAVPPPTSEIHPAHTVMKILEDLDDGEVLAKGHCFCRQQRKMDGDPCRLHLPEQACISVGPAAEHLLARGIGHRISKREAIDLVKEVEEKGAVHQIGKLMPLKDFDSGWEVEVICNCCWDCCGVLGNYNRGNIPFLLKSYYVAEMLDAEACNACGECEIYCPVAAIELTDEGVAEIERDLCCGCGLCASHCPEQAIRLEPFERDVFLPVLEPSQRRVS